MSNKNDWKGTYKPQIHAHYLPHLALSFTRHTDSLNQTFQLLSTDYSKSLHLQADRTLEFHTAGGRHYNTRIPRYGRDLQIDRRSAEALIPCAGVDADGNGEVFRLNMELGRFMKSYTLDVGGDDTVTIGSNRSQGGVNTGSVNCAAVAEDSHDLVAFGTSAGTVEFFDPRSRSPVALLNSPIANSHFGSADDPLAPTSRTEITALQFHPSGLTFATGTSTGLIHLYDLRSPLPLLKKDQGYDYPIQTLKFLTSSTSSNRTAHLASEPKILSADKRIVKIWDASNGSPWTSVEPAVDLHCIEWCRDSGMILTANEGRQQHSFFIPQLGPAPKWCSFLDNVVEEMAEDENDPAAYNSGGVHKPGEVYDNYKFLSMAQLKALNLEHLVGTTSLLRPYMHGYFVAQQLYEEARLISNPELWQEQRQKTIQERIEKERESRIRGNKSQHAKVKVNKALAQRILDREEKHERRKAKRALQKAEQNGEDTEMVDNDDADMAEVQQQQEAKKSGPALLNDPRFSALFTNEDFEVDEESTEYRALNAASAVQQRSTSVDGAGRNRLTAAELEDISDGRRGSSASISDDSDDQSDVDRRPSEPSSSKGRFANKDYTQSKKPNMQKARKGPQMRVSTSATSRSGKPDRHREKSFRSLAASMSETQRERRKGSPGQQRVVGNKEVSFTPSSKPKHGKGSHSHEGPTSRQGETSGRSHKDRRSASGNVFRRM